MVDSSKSTSTYDADVKKSLTLILNKGFCNYTHQRAVSEYNRIKDRLSIEDSTCVKKSLDMVSPGNTDVWGQEYSFEHTRFARNLNSIIQRCN